MGLRKGVDLITGAGVDARRLRRVNIMMEMRSRAAVAPPPAVVPMAALEWEGDGNGELDGVDTSVED